MVALLFNFAVEPGVSKLNMNLSQNPDTGIHLGKCEQPVIEELFSEMENAVGKILAEKTLRDLINSVRQNMSFRISGLCQRKRSYPLL
jgi:DNA-binding IscR family transcriptional regulator